MPMPFIGQIVWWYEGGNESQEPAAAVVTRISGCSLNLNIFDPQSYNQRIRDGVRHIADTNVKDADKVDSGCWDFTPHDKAVKRMLADWGDVVMKKKAG